MIVASLYNILNKIIIIKRVTNNIQQYCSSKFSVNLLQINLKNTFVEEVTEAHYIKVTLPLIWNYKRHLSSFSLSIQHIKCTILEKNVTPIVKKCTTRWPPQVWRRATSMKPSKSTTTQHLWLTPMYIRMFGVIAWIIYTISHRITCLKKPSAQPEPSQVLLISPKGWTSYEHTLRRQVNC